jgi:hypothetical protein
MRTTKEEGSMWTAIVLGGIVLALFLYAVGRGSRGGTGARGQHTDGGFMYPGGPHDEREGVPHYDSTADAESGDGDFGGDFGGDGGGGDGG